MIIKEGYVNKIDKIKQTGTRQYNLLKKKTKKIFDLEKR